MGCKAADFLISRERQKLGAPPFIGLIPLNKADEKRAIEHTQRFLDGQPERLEALFHQFPNLATWLVTHSLSEKYGANGHAVYRHIAQMLGIPLDTQATRKMLSSAFLDVCDRFGLPSRGLDRDVDVYLLHTGVSQEQLPHLIDAFLSQESAFGPPPVETTAGLNQWENDALDFLPTGVKVPRRAILWDETAYHADLFAQLHDNPAAFVPKIEFEQVFKQVFDQRLQEPRPASGRGRGAAPAPRPRLCWQSGALVLRLPRCEGRIRLRLDEEQQPLRLRGGEHWTLPQPWPRRLHWEIAGQPGQRTLLAHGGCAIFDRLTGRHLHDISQDSKNELVDSRDIAILARGPFTVADELAFELGAESYVGFATLGPRPVALALGGAQTDLRARPRRRLSLVGDEIANGPQGILYGPTARLQIETGLTHSKTRTLRVTHEQQSPRFVEVPIQNDGSGAIGLTGLLAHFPEAEAADPLRLGIELMAPGTKPGTKEHSARIKLSVWVWPGFRGQEHIQLHSVRPVGNLVRNKCRHVGLDDHGYLCLDREGGYKHACAVFRIGDDDVPFDLPWPDVTVTRHRAEGGPAFLPLGTRLSVSEEDRFDTISIRCPDQRAQLIIRGTREKRPFFMGLTRNLAVRDLLGPASDEYVRLRRENGSELVLFELIAARVPRKIDLRAAGNPIRLCLTFKELIDAVAVEVENETGNVERAEAALRHRPVAVRRPEWFHAEVCDDDAQGLELTLDGGWLDDGPGLARLLIRPEGRDSWHPLRTAQGASVAIALANPAADAPPQDADELRRRFEALCRWFSEPYAAECWPVLERTLVPRWRELGLRLRDVPGGDSAIMQAACLPPPDHAPPDWIPILHPVQFAPDLYAAAPPVFAALAASSDPGTAELAALATLNTARLRESSHLHETALLAFQNVRVAQDNGAPLKGFDPARFFRNLPQPQVDTDPSAGWFWRGSPVLGPGHWRAAHLRLAERLDEAGLFVGDTAEEEPQCQPSLLRLIQAAWNLEEEKLRPSAPLRNAESGEPDQVDRWASVLLSGFARASRLNEVDEYVKKLSAQADIQADISPEQALTGIARMLRLAPELFAFHLLLWQIARERP
ncbi:MAG: hypothetical protein GDA36_07065 [Rhodobacteraceae bacterium]|nr:hypothetical protein [Paracoccaceae bacterium]